MDTMMFAAMRLYEHRAAELERENRRRVQRAERHASVAASGAERAASAPAPRSPEPLCAPSGLALAGPSS